MSHHHLYCLKTFMKIVFRVDPNAVCKFYQCILFFYFTFCGLYHKYLDKILQIDRYYEFGLCKLLYSHYIYLTFEGGSKSAKGGPYLLVDLDPRGSISTSRFGPGSKSTSGYEPPGVQIYGVQINWDTGLIRCAC